MITHSQKPVRTGIQYCMKLKSIIKCNFDKERYTTVAKRRSQSRSFKEEEKNMLITQTALFPLTGYFSISESKFSLA